MKMRHKKPFTQDISISRYPITTISKLSRFSALLTFLAFSSAQAVPPACQDIFQNGLQSNREDGYIRFNYNSRLINPSSGTLLSTYVGTDAWSAIKSCGENHCSASGSAGPRLYADPLKTTTSTNTAVVPPHNKKALGQAANEFSSVRIDEWGTGEFSTAHNEYIIDTLEMSHKSTLRLPAGTYWIKTLKLEVDGKIDVLGEGTVTIFVGSPLTFPLNFRVNDGSKNPAKFAIYSYNELIFYVGSKTYAFAQVEDLVTVHYNAAIVGGVIARNLELLTQSQVRYDALAVQKLNFADLCRSL
ncbi:MAG: hypothetical protein V4732_19060 [Pseudomonadota bacterium]